MRFDAVESARRWGRQRVAGAIQRGWDWVSEHAAVTAGDRRAARFGRFGRGSWMAFPPGAVFGEEWIHLGAQTLIGPHVSLSAGMAPGQQMITNPVIRIGDRCMIGRGSHIVGHLSIEIGDDVYTGPYVYITDQNHGYTDIETPIGRQWPVESGVRIGAGSWLGAGVSILPGADIGDHVVVAAGSVVRGCVPPRCVVAGTPARVVRWYDDGTETWVSGQQHPMPVQASASASN